jgi:hypothetical protein
MIDVIDGIQRLGAHTPEPDLETMSAARRVFVDLVEQASVGNSTGVVAGRSSLRVRGRRLTRARLWMLPAVTAVAAVVMLVGLSVVSGPGGRGTAQAAVVRRLLAAVDPSSGVILHARVTIVGAGSGSSEFWQLTNPPYSYRGIKQSGRLSAEFADTGTQSESYDPATNTISERPDSAPAQFTNVFANIREALASGQAQLDGTTSIDGQNVYVVKLANGGTGYFNTSTYRPILLKVPSVTGQTITYMVAVFEYLPATTENLRLLSITDQHPGARIVTVDASAPPPSKG